MASTCFDTCKSEMVANIARQIKEDFYNYNCDDWLVKENISWHQHLGETRIIDGKQVEVPEFNFDGQDNHGSWQIRDNYRGFLEKEKGLGLGPWGFFITHRVQ
jgi:hypothetical protein